MVDMDDINSQYLPHVLQLQLSPTCKFNLEKFFILMLSSMQFYAIKIIIHRPFLSILSSDTTLSEQEIRRAQNSAEEAASCIARLVQIYRRHYTLRRSNIHTVHLIFTATLIHVHNACISENSTTQQLAARYLEICCQALSEMGVGYKNARRALEIITYIKANLLHSRDIDRLTSQSCQNEFDRLGLMSDIALGQQLFDYPINEVSPSLLVTVANERLLGSMMQPYEDDYQSLHHVDTGSNILQRFA